MADILVSGLCNIETCLKIQEFPLHYNAVNFPFHQINSALSGVGLNVATALNHLGNRIHFLSISGKDDIGKLVKEKLEERGISSRFIVEMLDKTSNTVVIYDQSGRRQIHCDLKNLQELSYPRENFLEALDQVKLAVICNINFNRHLLPEAKKRNIPIATDVHVLSDINDPYNQDYLKNADILFMSDEHLPASPEDFCHEVQNRFHNRIIVCGLGAKGALLLDREKKLVKRFPAVVLRKIENTIGAGDALFSAFVDSWVRTGDSELSIQKAVYFASWKIGAANASEGFLTRSELEEKFLNK